MDPFSAAKAPAPARELGVCGGSTEGPSAGFGTALSTALPGVSEATEPPSSASRVDAAKVPAPARGLDVGGIFQPLAAGR